MLRSMGGAKGEGRAFDWRVISRMLTFLQPHRAKMAVAFVLMLVVTALTLLTPYLVKVAIDQNITQGDAAGLTRTSLLIAAALLGRMWPPWGSAICSPGWGSGCWPPCATSLCAICKCCRWAITINTLWASPFRASSAMWR
ncbi:MAG: hypothetical protein R2911_22410 [Caldilineaceae bacterium]